MKAASLPNDIAFLPFARTGGLFQALRRLWVSARAGERAQRRSGKVWLVGAGPGDPELLTLRALKLIRQADVIAYDHLVGADILKLVPSRTRRICVGKRAGRHSMPQGEINALLVMLARRYGRVVRLKGGDPGLFARTGEEIEALSDAGIAYEIVPGVTAALGCAAAAGIPLTQRGIAHSVHFVAGHLCGDAADDVDWARLASPSETLVLYMARANLMRHAARLVDHGLPGSTPVLIVHDGTRPSQSSQRFSLADCASGLAANASPAPALIIIGEVASQARVSPAQAAPRIQMIPIQI